MKTQKCIATVGILAVFAIALVVFAACETPTGPAATGKRQLSGTISISPNTDVSINTQLTASYTGGNETVRYQWNKDGTAISGATSTQYTPTEMGSYTVTVSATGYDSKTSAAVDVTDPSLPTLSGDITISPNIGVTTGIQLTASYSGSETVLSYQWRKDGVNVGTNSTQYTPTATGSYTVTVGAAGYNSKTSAAVTVSNIVPPENLPVAERWYSWVDDSATATVNYSVDGDGVCTITVGGIAQPNNETDGWGKWKANAAYRYTVKTNTCYTYVFEAWTQSGDREVHCQYYTDNDEEVYMGNDITLTETPETYTIKGKAIPKSGVQAFEFQCADQLGTFYVKILAIYAYTPSLEYELINDIDSPNNGTYRVVSATGMSGAVVIPATYKNLPVTEIGNDAFNGTGITAVHIPASVTTIGDGAFSNCTSLATVTFAANSQLESIPNGIFWYCGSLTNITIPASVTEIGWGSFFYCTSLTSITIPASVMFIDGSAFANCTGLTVIIVDNNSPHYASEGGILYNKDKTELFAYPSVSGAFTIPANVTKIGDSAFIYSERLTSVTIPEGITDIDNRAFDGCSISEITIPASVMSVGWRAFWSWENNQTIYVKGYASEAEADDAWGEDWRGECNAVIKYWNGSAYQ